MSTLSANPVGGRRADWSRYLELLVLLAPPLGQEAQFQVGCRGDGATREGGHIGEQAEDGPCQSSSQPRYPAARTKIPALAACGQPSVGGRRYGLGRGDARTSAGNGWKNIQARPARPPAMLPGLGVRAQFVPPHLVLERTVRKSSRCGRTMSRCSSRGVELLDQEPTFGSGLGALGRDGSTESRSW